MKEDIIMLLEDLNRESQGEFIYMPIRDYVDKILCNATIITIQEKKTLCGFIAFYNNDSVNKTSFLTMLAINPSSQGTGLGRMLLYFSIDRLKNLGYRKYFLEVHKTNEKAISLYKQVGFKILDETVVKYKMVLEL